MKITIDRDINAVYIYFMSEADRQKHSGKLKTIMVNPDINIDYTNDDKLFGMEILDSSILNLKTLENISLEDITEIS